jgi:hypothetical protein
MWQPKLYRFKPWGFSLADVARSSLAFAGRLRGLALWLGGSPSRSSEGRENEVSSLPDFQPQALANLV